MPAITPHSIVEEMTRLTPVIRYSGNNLLLKLSNLIAVIYQNTRLNNY